jgi:hypothetical protein
MGHLLSASEGCADWSMVCFCYIDGNVPQEFVVFVLGSVGVMHERFVVPQLQMSM